MAGTTIRRPNRSTGSSPVRAHSYAVERLMPRIFAASSTVYVARSTVGAMVVPASGLSRLSGEGFAALGEGVGIPTVGRWPAISRDPKVDPRLACRRALAPLLSSRSQPTHRPSAQWRSLRPARLPA